MLAARQLYAPADVAWIVAELSQLVGQARGSSRWVGTFVQPFDINFDIDQLIVEDLVDERNILSINCI
jgi:hypothetical protein